MTPTSLATFSQLIGGSSLEAGFLGLRFGMGWGGGGGSELGAVELLGDGGQLLQFRR